MDQTQELAERIKVQLPKPVEQIDTHGAVILLSGNRAYKLKRPVHFSFMDFSTVDARLAALTHELELNRRTAPLIYKRLLPVGIDGQLGQEPAYDWALEMQRFDNSQRLDRLLAQGKISNSLLDELANEIADFHQSLPKLGSPPDVIGQIDAVGLVIQGNEDDLSHSIGTVFNVLDVEALNAATRREFERRKVLLAARQSWVRHCHGDLHSENIVLIDGKPVLFDCIEFNDAFAQIDVLYDLAFLVMDLQDRGFQKAAWRVMQTYLDRLPQDEGMALWPLFLSIRGAIRAKVEAFAGHAQKAKRYLQTANDCLENTKPQLIAIGGLSGTGKSTIAREIAPAIDAHHLRSDIERKRLFNVSPNDKLPAQAYRPEISQNVFAQLGNRAAKLLAAGRSVVIDGVFAKIDERNDMARIAQEAGVKFHGYWLQTNIQTRLERIDKRIGDVSDADVDVAQRQESYDIGVLSWTPLDATRSVTEVANTIASDLNL